jgi:hypothetical protein
VVVRESLFDESPGLLSRAKIKIAAEQSSSGELQGGTAEGGGRSEGEERRGRSHQVVCRIMAEDPFKDFDGVFALLDDVVETHAIVEKLLQEEAALGVLPHGGVVQVQEIDGLWLLFIVWILIIFQSWSRSAFESVILICRERERDR